MNAPLPESIRRALETVSLDDKYSLAGGRAFTSPDYDTASLDRTRQALLSLAADMTSFESSFGELGGCPVPPGSTGNVSTEDVVSMLHEMGVETGIDLTKLLAASGAAQELLGRSLGAHLLTAGPVEWNPEAAG